MSFIYRKKTCFYLTILLLTTNFVPSSKGMVSWLTWLTGSEKEKEKAVAVSAPEEWDTLKTTLDTYADNGEIQIMWTFFLLDANNLLPIVKDVHSSGSYQLFIKGITDKNGIKYHFLGKNFNVGDEAEIHQNLKDKLKQINNFITSQEDQLPSSESESESEEEDEVIPITKPRKKGMVSRMLMEELLGLTEETDPTHTSKDEQSNNLTTVVWIGGMAVVSYAISQFISSGSAPSASTKSSNS